jgi:glucosamine--fructose-6-phosphate aminotransferase (isomerizing)
MAEVRGALDDARIEQLVSALVRLPDDIAGLIEGDTADAAQAIAGRDHGREFFLYLGRHLGLAAALEGALKLKEIAYVPTDAYAAGEMKHGPIALLAEGTPVVVVATESPVLDKVASNMQQVRARGARVIALAAEGTPEIEQHADDVLWLPATDWMLQPLLAVVPLQLLAYRIARLRGLNVDQPRNLAKTVTVE